MMEARKTINRAGICGPSVLDKWREVIAAQGKREGEALSSQVWLGTKQNRLLPLICPPRVPNT